MAAAATASRTSLRSRNSSKGQLPSPKPKVNVKSATAKSRNDEAVSVQSRRARRSKIQRHLANEMDFLKKDSVDLLESQLHEVYVWVDEAPITKVKRNLNKDFADGSAIAEVIRHYLPENRKYMVDLSDY